jgi:hypothetical protein
VVQTEHFTCITAVISNLNVDTEPFSYIKTDNSNVLCSNAQERQLFSLSSVDTENLTQLCYITMLCYITTGISNVT